MELLYTLTKQFVINAIDGGKFPLTKDLRAYEKRGILYYSGNQWNEDWAWRKDKLNELSLEELIYIYKDLNQQTSGDL